jgi:hypothetical protein
MRMRNKSDEAKICHTVINRSIQFIYTATLYRRPTAGACIIPHLLGGVDDVAACNLALVHEIVHVLELGETDGLVRALDQTTAVELERLGGVLAVADVAALDGDHLDDRLEDGSLEVGAGRQTDAHDGAAWTDVLLW